uniref:Enoyl-CoA delta isomerase 1, mitochondrial n=1 Tax=Lygus hesperus TaxID=30085 RepID=A0A0A9XNU3_LYGHE
MLTVWINLAGVSFGMSSPTRPGIRVQRTHTHTHTRRHPTKTVAAINGHAIAAGTFLAAACDIRVALDNPKYLVGLNEVSNGFCIPYRMLVVCQNAFHSYSVAQQVCVRSYTHAHAFKYPHYFAVGAPVWKIVIIAFCGTSVCGFYSPTCHRGY